MATSKQDMTYARTASDIERKYNFGKSFGEVFGLLGEAKRIAEEAENAVNNLDTDLDQEGIFNRLTNNGQEQGIYRGKDGHIYINASYILSGVIKGIRIIGEEGTIGGLTMSKNTLTTTYRKEYSFAPTDMTEITTIRQNWSTYTDEQKAEYLAKYDLNMNGRIDAGDATALLQMVNGTIPSYTEGVIAIDATNPVEAIKIEVTGGYRAGEVVKLGLGGVVADNISGRTVTGDTFCCGTKSGYTGNIPSGSTLIVEGGIITGVS